MLRTLLGSILVLLTSAGTCWSVENSLFSVRPLLESEWVFESSVAELDGDEVSESAGDPSSEEDPTAITGWGGKSFFGRATFSLPTLQDKRIGSVFFAGTSDFLFDPAYSGSPRAPPVCVRLG